MAHLHEELDGKSVDELLDMGGLLTTRPDPYTDSFVTEVTLEGQKVRTIYIPRLEVAQRGLQAFYEALHG